MAQSIILPTYGNNLLYRIPDYSVNPTIPGLEKDYFVSPINKNFIFKNSSGVVTYVNIDFWGLDNSYLVGNNKFTTI
jgi:hypothetical protein